MRPKAALFAEAMAKPWRSKRCLGPLTIAIVRDVVLRRSGVCAIGRIIPIKSALWKMKQNAWMSKSKRDMDALRNVAD